MLVDAVLVGVVRMVRGVGLGELPPDLVHRMAASCLEVGHAVRVDYSVMTIERSPRGSPHCSPCLALVNAVHYS